MVTAPGLARSAAGIATLSCPEFTKTVVRSAPFQFATAPNTKFAPLIVTHVFAPGTVTLLGVNPEIVGAGFAFTDRGTTAGPCIITILPLPVPQKSVAVRNASPLFP